MENNQINGEQIAPVENQTIVKPKVRDANFELLRILSMLMIICLHLCGHGQFMYETTGASKVILTIFHVASIISVNLFVMITCWFLIEKKIKYKKLIRLWAEVFFYSALIYIIFVACGWKSFEWEDLLNFIPVVSGRYWFVSSYFIFYLSIPFLNAMLANISKKQHLGLCIGLIVLSLISLGPVTAMEFVRGYSAIWFMTIFIIMHFVKKYNVKELNGWLYLLIFVVASAISYFTGYFYSNPLTFLASYCIFMIFKKIKIKSVWLSKTISFISATTFGIYLIHEHPLIRDVLYTHILHTQNFFASPYAVLIFIGFNFAIFVACMIIDILRKYLFKLVELIISKIKTKIKKKPVIEQKEG